jgi:hypothetical protein
MTDQWTSLIKDELYLVSTELKNYTSDNDREQQQQQQQQEGNGSTAEGPIPEALLNR